MAHAKAKMVGSCPSVARTSKSMEAPMRWGVIQNQNRVGLGDYSIVSTYDSNPWSVLPQVGDA